MLDRRSLLLAAGGLALGGVAHAEALDPACIPPPEFFTADPDNLQALVQRTRVPAVAGIVVTRSDVHWLGAAGVRQLDRPDQVTPEDNWHLGSNTKAMTAALYARLVEAGDARWDATMSELFPQLRINPAYASLPIERLLSHRAGIIDSPVYNNWLPHRYADRRPVTEQRLELARMFLERPPGAAIGTFHYSNVGFVIAGAAMEGILGSTWEEAMTARLFHPLQATSAGFGAPGPDQPVPHSCMRPRPGYDNPLVHGPAGRVNVGLRDWGKFLQLFLNQGGELLSPTSITKLTTPIRGPGDRYGLGWYVGPPPSRPWALGPSISHAGTNRTWHTTAIVAPERGIAIAMATNTDPEGVRATESLARGLIDKKLPPVT